MSVEHSESRSSDQTMSSRRDGLAPREFYKDPSLFQRLGEMLLEERARKNLTQVQLCAITGIPHTRISSFEHGRPGMTVTTLVRLITALEIEPERVGRVLMDMENPQSTSRPE